MTYDPTQFVPGRVLLKSVITDESPWSDATYLALDAHGFLVGATETEAEFRARLTALDVALDSLDTTLLENGKMTLYKGFTVHEKDRIPSDLFQAAYRTTFEKFGFAVDWVPAFYPEKMMGLLWAGCTVMFDDHPYPVFTIRRAFQKSERFLKIYSRNELLSHESCHVARAPLDEPYFEEFFAYSLSQSGVRRWCGNMFRTDLDALLFVGPLLLFSVFQGVMLYFNPSLLEHSLTWLLLVGLCLLCPLWLVFSNIRSRAIYFRAESNLKRAEITHISPILFRCTKDEIFQFSKSKTAESVHHMLDEMTQKSPLRWRVIRCAFLQNITTKESPHA